MIFTSSFCYLLFCIEMEKRNWTPRVTLFVGSIPHTLREDGIKSIFSQAVFVYSVRRYSNDPTGYSHAFVEVDSLLDASAAILIFHKRTTHTGGIKLQVSIAKKNLYVSALGYHHAVVLHGENDERRSNEYPEWNITHVVMCYFALRYRSDFTTIFILKQKLCFFFGSHFNAD